MLLDISLDTYIPDLQRRLKDAGISHRRLARLLGADPAQVSRWMNRHTTPTVKSILRIEQALRDAKP